MGRHVRDGRLLGALEHNLFRGRRIPQQRAQQRVVQAVPGLVTAEFADEAVAEQIQITDRIEDLVLDEFVLVSQAIFIHHADIVEYDRILERAAQGEVVRAQRLQITHEAERASATDLLEK